MNELAENYWCIASRNPTGILPKINYGFNKLLGKQCNLSFQCWLSVREELMWFRKSKLLIFGNFGTINYYK